MEALRLLYTFLESMTERRALWLAACRLLTHGYTEGFGYIQSLAAVVVIASSVK